MKTCGYTTCNNQGNFEVNWTIEPTLFTKIFKRPNEFRYWTTSKELKHLRYKGCRAGLYYEWFDMDSNRVSCLKTLDKISQAVYATNLNEIENSWRD